MFVLVALRLRLVVASRVLALTSYPCVCVCARAAACVCVCCVCCVCRVSCVCCLACCASLQAQPVGQAPMSRWLLVAGTTRISSRRRAVMSQSSIPPCRCSAGMRHIYLQHGRVFMSNNMSCRPYGATLEDHNRMVLELHRTHRWCLHQHRRFACNATYTMGASDSTEWSTSVAESSAHYALAAAPRPCHAWP